MAARRGSGSPLVQQQSAATGDRYNGSNIVIPASFGYMALAVFASVLVVFSVVLVSVNRVHNDDDNKTGLRSNDCRYKNIETFEAFRIDLFE